MIYIIDIDGTICATHGSDYLKSCPHVDRIAKVNKLYDAGNTIIYWTARGMNSGKDHTDLTRRQLDQWGCKYHEIRMSKPVYDVWIDDKAQTIEEFFD